MIPMGSIFFQIFQRDIFHYLYQVFMLYTDGYLYTSFWEEMHSVFVAGLKRENWGLSLGVIFLLDSVYICTERKNLAEAISVDLVLTTYTRLTCYLNASVS